MNSLSGYQGESIRLPNGQVVKHGYGIMRFSTGAVYKGQWRNNKMHGFGEYDWADGNLYIGEFADGKQHGMGIYKWPTGGKYSGGWENDRMSGYGEYTRSDNVRYIGTWKEDVQYGLGRKVVPERIAYGPDRISSVERVFEERWGEGKVLLSQKEILIHPGQKMHSITRDREAYADCSVICKEKRSIDEYKYMSMEDVPSFDIHRLRVSTLQSC